MVEILSQSTHSKGQVEEDLAESEINVSSEYKLLREH